jgi:succinoglycan biosynthesis transport protein ExoP
VAKGVIVQPVPKSSVLEVNFYSGNPTWSANFLDELVDRAISKYTSLYEATRAQQFYRSQRDLLASRVDQAQAALTAFRERVGPELLTFNRDQLRDRIALLEQDRATTRGTVAELKARMNASPETIFSDANSAGGSDLVVNPSVSAIKARLLELQMKRSELIARYAPGSTMISDVDRQIEEANRLLNQERSNSVSLYRQEASSRIEAANARLDSIGQQLAEYREKLAKLETIAPEWERLQSDLDTQRTAYGTYLRKEEEARVSTALDESQLLNITVAQAATTPRDPEASPMIMLIVAGGGVGLLLGVGIALLRDWIDPSIKSTGQAERITGVPVLAEIPL